jgi:hypothetical protein
MLLPETTATRHGFVLDVKPAPDMYNNTTRKVALGLGSKKQSHANLRAPPPSHPSAFAPSPTLNVEDHDDDDDNNIQNYPWDSHRLSYAASSVLTEDLDNLQIPHFETSLDSDTNTTLDEDDFDLDTPSEEAPYELGLKSEQQSSVTLLRAELILANAKKRLNLMDQNLRGAREIVTPLTAANLRRATSLQMTPPVRNSSFSRPRYVPQQPQTQQIRQVQGSLQTRQAQASPQTRQAQASPQTRQAQVVSQTRQVQASSQTSHVQQKQHTRGASDSQVRPDDRRHMALRINPTPSWEPGPVRTTRSSEILRHTRSPRSPLSPDLTLDTVSEERSVTSQASARSLREQMMHLRGRISTLKERAQEENLRRRSISNLRDSCPLTNADATAKGDAEGRPRLTRITRTSKIPGAWVSAEIIDSDNDGQEVEEGAEQEEDEDDDNCTLARSNSDDNSTDRTSTPTTSSTTYKDAPETSSPPSNAPRHEDRHDAFDYSKFFLHSATGSFSPNTPTRNHIRSTSLSSTDSCLTARAYPVATSGDAEQEGTEDAAAPETPEALRHIEAQRIPAASRPQQYSHHRGLSAESLATIATFETAREGAHSQQHGSIAQWLSQSSSAATSLPIHDEKDEQSSSGFSSAIPSSSFIARMHPATVLPSSVSLPVLYPAQQQQQNHLTLQSSATTLAVAALLTSHSSSSTQEPPTDRRMSLVSKDETLIYGLMDSIRELMEELQKGGGGEERRRVLRGRLEAARKVIDGEIDVEGDFGSLA